VNTPWASTRSQSLSESSKSSGIAPQQSPSGPSGPRETKGAALVSGEQIAREKAEILNAPAIKVGQLTMRCHFCGQMSSALTRIAPTHPDGQVRWKGDCCNAKR
jgi:hypothetical protein